MSTTQRPFHAATLVAAVAAAAIAAFGLPAAAGVRLELHFESLCKQCQIHQGAIDDLVVHGGDESTTAAAGVLPHLELSIDYYGTKDCEAAANATHSEHGPDMCVADRYHLCAQQLGGGAGTGAAAMWWPFTHCMFMNIDQLKCGVNSHCADRASFNASLRAAVPLCAAVAGMSADAITACAESAAGLALAQASYARTARTLADGFAPAYVDGAKVTGADDMWRKTPDNILYGRTLLATVCQAAGENGTAVGRGGVVGSGGGGGGSGGPSLPSACRNASVSVAATE